MNANSAAKVSLQLILLSLSMSTSAEIHLSPSLDEFPILADPPSPLALWMCSLYPDKIH